MGDLRMEANDRPGEQELQASSEQRLWCSGWHKQGCILISIHLSKPYHPYSTPPRLSRVLCHFRTTYILHVNHHHSTARCTLPTQHTHSVIANRCIVSDLFASRFSPYLAHTWQPSACLQRTQPCRPARPPRCQQLPHPTAHCLFCHWGWWRLVEEAVG